MKKPPLPGPPFPLTLRPLLPLSEGQLLLKPTPHSTAQDYDFLLGPQTVWHQKLKQRLCGSEAWEAFKGQKNTTALLGGLGNVEEHFLHGPTGLVEGVALRLFDPATRLWSLYWADSLRGTLDPPLQGSFDGPLGVFFGSDTFEGRPVWVQFQYDRSDPQYPIWGQAFSPDGVQWEWNWFMYYGR